MTDPSLIWSVPRCSCDLGSRLKSYEASLHARLFTFYSQYKRWTLHFAPVYGWTSDDELCLTRHTELCYRLETHTQC